MEEILIPAIVFATMFGIFYLFITSRHKERMALIEKGISNEIFNKADGNRNAMKTLLITIAFLIMGIGIGIFLGYSLYQGAGIDDDVAFPGAIFITGGLGLFLGYKQASK